MDQEIAINHAAAINRKIRRCEASQCDSHTSRRSVVGLSYHGSRNRHSRIENTDIQGFRIANLEERVVLRCASAHCTTDITIRLAYADT